jgi:hypothetical protein
VRHLGVPHQPGLSEVPHLEGRIGGGRVGEAASGRSHRGRPRRGGRIGGGRIGGGRISVVTRRRPGRGSRPQFGRDPAAAPLRVEAAGASRPPVRCSPLPAHRGPPPQSAPPARPGPTSDATLARPPGRGPARRAATRPHERTVPPVPSLSSALSGVPAVSTPDFADLNAAGRQRRGGPAPARPMAARTAPTDTRASRPTLTRASRPHPHVGRRALLRSPADASAHNGTRLLAVARAVRPKLGP